MFITDIRIETMAGSVIERGFIRVAGSKIAEIGDMRYFKSANGEDCYQFSGAFALPGLVDAHSHLGLFGDGMGIEGDDGNEVADPVTPQIRAIDGVNAMDKGFSEALEYGVTTVVTGPGSANAISGQSLAMKTLGCCVDDMVIKPALAMKMALGENPKGTYGARPQSPTTRMSIAALIREELCRARRYMQDMESASEDDEIDEPEYDAKSEALIPVLKGEMPVHIHAHRADDIFTAVRLINEFSLKGVIIHATEAHAAAERFAQCGIPIISGPIMGTRSKPELLGFSRGAPAILCKYGVKMALCTDHPEMPQEMLMLSAAIAHSEGMLRCDALSAITSAAAEICGLQDRVGTLEKGKDADIVIYKNDPIKGFEKPVAVFINGIKVK